MRGRLIQRFKAEFARLDTTTTEANGAYDHDFREIIADDSTTGDGIGIVQRAEHDVVMVPCQIGSRVFEALRAFDQGNVPRSDVTMYLHSRDLENLILVDATTGESLLHVGDRLVSIRSFQDESLVQSIRTPPGLYVREATPSGWGIHMASPTRNLLRVVLEPRDAAV